MQMKNKNSAFQRRKYLKILIKYNIRRVRCHGLMNMAPFGLSSGRAHQLFEDIVKTRDELEKKFDCTLREDIKGMSVIYKEAVVAGSTMIRIGRILFSN